MYTPGQNGISERHNLTAMDGVKTLLNLSGIPQKFWGEAVLYLTYVWNRKCHKANKQTSLKLYSGRKPSVTHLKSFGCLAYMGVPRQTRRN